MRKHIYEYDEVAVGGNLAAIFYSYMNQCPVFFKERKVIFSHEYFEKDFPLKNIFLKNKEQKLQTPAGELEVGDKKLQVYNRLLFILSLSGLIPFSNKIEKIRLEEENLLRVVTKAKSATVKYKKLRIFDAQDVEGLTQNKVMHNKKLIYDKFKIKTAAHNLNFIKTEDDFVSEIIFLNNDEILVISRLHENEIQECDFSLIVMKYKIRAALSNAGIQKRKTQKEVIIDYLGRDVYNCDYIKYKKEKNILIDKRKIEEICQDIPPHISLKMHSHLLDVYPWRLNHLLLDLSGMIR